MKGALKLLFLSKE